MWGQLLLGASAQGLAWGLLALGLWLAFRIIRFADLTVDGSFAVGAGMAARLIVAGAHPAAAALCAAAIGALGGLITGLLHVKGRISDLLAGILTMSALYTVNLRIMGKANISLLRQPTLVSRLESLGLPRDLAAFLLFLAVVLVVKFALDWLLHTEYGLTMRATGENPDMVRSTGVNTGTVVIVTLVLANALVGLSGGLAAQYQGFADASFGTGAVIVGLASVIMGEVVMSGRSIFLSSLAVVGGSVLYRVLVQVALRMGFEATDLKLVTAVLVTVALLTPRLRTALRAGN